MNKNFNMRVKSPIRLVNRTVATIPAWAALEIDEYEGGGLLSVKQPSANNLSEVAFNLGSVLRPGAEGEGAVNWPVRALFSGAEPYTSQPYGTKTGSFLLWPNFFGMRGVAGAIEGTTALFFPETVCGANCGLVCTRNGGTNDAPNSLALNSNFPSVGFPLPVLKTTNCPNPIWQFGTAPGNTTHVLLQCLGTNTGRFRFVFDWGFFGPPTYIFEDYGFADSFVPFVLEFYDARFGYTFTLTAP